MDTLPSTTLTDITQDEADPGVNYGRGTMDAATAGQGYLLTNEIRNDNRNINAELG